MKFKRKIQILAGCFLLLLTEAAPGQIVISEFMAANTHGIADNYGAHSDWIELYNTGTDPVLLDGWYLTDENGSPTKWQFPQGMAPLQPNGYFLVWASGQNKVNSANPLHTNFKLGREGGYLALVDPNLVTVSSFDGYPPQYPDISYGRDRVDSNLVGFFYYPTPGSQNTNGLAAPTFSHKTGIYTNSSITLTLSSTVGTIRYTTDGSLPSINSLLYTGPIVLASNATIKARAFPLSNSTELPSEVVARNFIFLDNTTADFNSNLPLLIVSTEGRIIQQDVPSGASRTKGSLTILDVKNAESSPRHTPDVQVLAEFEFFGQTAIGFPKKPIRVETQDAYGNDQRVSILGLPAGSDYRLRNPYNDKTLLNEFLSTELYEQMGHYSVRRRYVEAFVDSGGGRLNYANDYYGVMVLFESIQIDHNRLNLKRIPGNTTNEPAISGGYIFKKDKDSAGDLNFSTSGRSAFAGMALKMHDPKPNDLRINPGAGPLTPGGTAQVDYLKGYLNAMEGALYANNWLNATGTNHYSAYMNIDSFVDLHWMVEFAKYVDGHRISTFFYKNRDDKVSAGPIWGWNLGFGNANYLLSGQTNGWYYEQLGQLDHGWMRRLIEGNPNIGNGVGDPDFVQRIADRWGELRTNVLNGSRLQERIDELAALLEGPANRDFTKYETLGKYLWAEPDGGVATAGSPGNIDGRDVDFVRPLVYNDGTTNSVIGQMKKFVSGRFRWIDSQFTLAPVIQASPGTATNSFSLTIATRPGAQIYYTLDGSDPRGPGGVTNGALYTGPITVNANVKLVARARGTNAWKNTWSSPAIVPLYTAIPTVRITEIMYHPVDSTNGLHDSSDFEYLEVRNIGDSPLNVNHFSLTGGIQFQFPDITLQAGQYAVVAKNAAIFQSQYGAANPGVLVLGEFQGQLNNSGDHIILTGGLGEPILDFAYEDSWYPTTDGLGFSLVCVDESAPTENWGLASHWRVSGKMGGSPGHAEPGSPTILPVVINEVLPGQSFPYVIELFNPNSVSVDIGGWFLADDFKNPIKYEIPVGTILNPLGFVNLNEPEKLPWPSEPNHVYLFSGDGTNLTGYAHHVQYGQAPDGKSFGRYILSTGAERFVLQSTNSLGFSNADPAIGPIVLTEINAQPPNIGVDGLPYSNTRDEYLEFQNITGTNVPLYRAGISTNSWRLAGQVQFTFPVSHPSSVIPPGEFFFVVSFDPDANPPITQQFRERNGLPGAAILFGPWSGELADTGGIIELLQPDITSEDQPLVYFQSDRVHYSNTAPWPSGWKASGLTLQKTLPSGLGDDPANWAALPPSPGTTRVSQGTPPQITSQPGDQTVPTGRNLPLLVTATGTDLYFQWRRNDINIPGATNSLLTISNFQSSDIGLYNVLVYNSAGGALGHDFRLTARTGLTILQAPSGRTVITGGSTNFTVSAIGSGPLSYRWQMNGADVTASNSAGVNTQTLTITNIQLFNEGTYSVTVSDDYDTTSSAPVGLTIVYAAKFILQPVSQPVVEGRSVTLSVGVAGTTPMTFRWRKQTGQFSFTTLATEIGSSNSYFTITNFQASDATNYNVSVSNVLGFASGGPFSGRSYDATLTLLADSDHDGLPDVWESARPGFNATDPLDAQRDDDGDGMSNLAEYIAGTDYLDPQSYLKVAIAPSGTSASFMAVSNRTYSVLYVDHLGLGSWSNLGSVPAFDTNSLRTVHDFYSGTNRFYRLVTPAQP